ncbi:hypothetical protein BYT27DRAFT_7179596 [Phlegmacium glaucopus]|nr:hypothetical protein BYT27DRAFT_7179596 [Phlegmacium glaucopus]
MRWSLILSTFITVLSALSFVCVALVVPSSWVELERRDSIIRKIYSASSTDCQANAEQHPYSYDGDFRKPLNQKDRAAHAAHVKKMLKEGSMDMDADHIYEIQMINHQIREVWGLNLDVDGDDQKLINQIRDIINGPGNMVLIPRNINQEKGRVITKLLKGKSTTCSGPLKKFIKLSSPTAIDTAKELTKAFKASRFRRDILRKPTFEQTFSEAIKRISNFDEPSPAGSSESSSAVKETPHNAMNNEGTSKPDEPSPAGGIRASARIAASKKEGKK